MTHPDDSPSDWDMDLRSNPNNNGMVKGNEDTRATYDTTVEHSAPQATRTMSVVCGSQIVQRIPSNNSLVSTSSSGSC